jgi:hypothetical protein
MSDSQARAFWRWSNFIVSSNADGKPVLRVNLDETSLKFHVAPRPGLVVESVAGRRRQPFGEGCGADLKARRSSVTLVAFACDSDAHQATLPQVIVLGERVVSVAEAADLSEQCQDHVFAIRRRTSWVNAALAVQLVHLLAACLKGVLRSHRVVLYMDTCPAHTHVSVLRACSREGIYPVFVPAGTTSLLQPLDVAVFAKFKGWVVKETERLRLTSASGRLTRPEILGLYRQGVDAVIRRGSWGRAFDLCGLGDPAAVSRRLLERLGHGELFAVGDSLPSAADLEAVFPRGVSVPVEALFRRVLLCSTVPVLRLSNSARLPSDSRSLV